ncbi:MAG: endonuclease domain-containing protein [Clostridia bacterium]|nr:endonuclease domain-containing protein [Clostridia bacterium]
MDGGQHYEYVGMECDKERDRYLRDLGFVILRYCNLDINKNFDGVCEDILNHLK